MTLKRGKSESTISGNVADLMKAGYPQSAAEVIARRRASTETPASKYHSADTAKAVQALDREAKRK